MSSPEGRWDSNVWIGVYSYKPTQLLQHLPFVWVLTGTNAVSAQDLCFCTLIFQIRHPVLQVSLSFEFFLIKTQTFSEIVFLKVFFSSIKSVLFKQEITFSGSTSNKKYIFFLFWLDVVNSSLGNYHKMPNKRAKSAIKLCFNSI